MSYRLTMGLASRLWEEKDQDFKPISTSENLRDLHYIYSNESNSGYGIVAFRNRSFKKNYYVDFPNLNFGKNPTQTKENLIIMEQSTHRA